MTSNPVLAYRNEGFLDSDDGRPLRILAEYLQPLQALQRERVHDTIVFFGSARLREDGLFGRYYTEARQLARLVTEWSLSLPCEARRFSRSSGPQQDVLVFANAGVTRSIFAFGGIHCRQQGGEQRACRSHSGSTSLRATG